MRRAQRYIRQEQARNEDEDFFPRTYQCEDCGGTFTAEWSEEEALAEKERIFGDYPLEDCAQICDDCFKEFMNNFN